MDDIKGLLSNISSKDAITASAQACAKTLQDIVAEVKAGSASLGPQLQEAQETFLTHQTENPPNNMFLQVSLLSSTKVVVNSVGELLKQARNLGSDQTELEELATSAKVLFIAPHFMLLSDGGGKRDNSAEVGQKRRGHKWSR